jgi:hypothetical protein
MRANDAIIRQGAEPPHREGADDRDEREGDDEHQQDAAAEGRDHLTAFF